MLREEITRQAKASSIMRVDSIRMASAERTKGASPDDDAMRISISTTSIGVTVSSKANINRMSLRRQSTTADIVDKTEPSASGPNALLYALARELTCTTVSLLPTKAGGESVTITTDGSVPPAAFTGAEIERCLSQKQVIGVDEYATALLVPVVGADGSATAVIRCDNKVSPESDRVGVSFTKADAAIVSVVGPILCSLEANKKTAGKTATLRSATDTSSTSDEAL
jgi:hypothetical protein